MNENQPHTLTCLTFNTWGIRITPYQKLRVRAISSVIHERPEDIICLQEVWATADRTLIVSENRDSYPYSYYFSSKGVGSGLLTLSKYPIIETQFTQFAVRGRADRVKYGDYIAGKGIGLTRIRTPYGVIDVYNTHTVAQYDSDHRDEFRVHRCTQHYRITQFIAEHTTINPVILVGDFNMRPDQPNYDLITTLGQVSDTYATVNHDDAGYTLSTENPFHEVPDLRLDYIFTRDGEHQSIIPIESSVTMKYLPYTAQRIAYADHFGVSTTLQFAPKISSEAQNSPDTESVYRIYEYMAQVIASGTENARQRQVIATQQLQHTLIASAPIVLMGLLLPKRLRWIVWSFWSLIIMIRWRIAKGDFPQEYAELQAIYKEVEKQKARLSAALR